MAHLANNVSKHSPHTPVLRKYIWTNLLLSTYVCNCRRIHTQIRIYVGILCIRAYTSFIFGMVRSFPTSTTYFQKQKNCTNKSNDILVSLGIVQEQGSKPLVVFRINSPRLGNKWSVSTWVTPRRLRHHYDINYKWGWRMMEEPQTGQRLWLKSSSVLSVYTIYLQIIVTSFT